MNLRSGKRPARALWLAVVYETQNSPSALQPDVQVICICAGRPPGKPRYNSIVLADHGPGSLSDALSVAKGSFAPFPSGIRALLCLSTDAEPFTQDQQIVQDGC